MQHLLEQIEPEKSVKKSERGRTVQVTSIIGMVAHILAVCIPVVVGVPALLNFGFFSWHPLCMTVAYAFLMTEGILVFSPESSLVGQASRSAKVNYHGYILLCALLCELGGFAVIYSNKQYHNRPHFASWHGLIGLITVGYTVLQMLAGLFLKYGTKIRLPQGLTLGKLKLYHSLSGCTLFLLSCVVLMLGMYSSWFVQNVHEYVWGGSMVGMVLLMGIGISHLAHIIKTRLTPRKR